MASEAKLAIVNPQLAGGNPKRRVRSWPNATWVEEELQQLANGLKEGNTVAEVGIGAGSYARSLSIPAAVRVTVDLPVQSVSRPWQWPVADDSVDLLISVDALHYETDVEAFVREAARVTRTTRLFAFVARSRENLQHDGLAKFFPEAVNRALPLVTEIPVLEKMLEKQGLYCAKRVVLEGQLQIDEVLLRAIAHRELTGLATLSEEEFAKGVDDMKVAIGKGEAAWASKFTMLVCRKVRPWKSDSGPASGTGMI
ncbi:MAG: methyltransferase domain-containing protein [Candidatus Sumerlaeaceae bacterium]